MASQGKRPRFAKAKPSPRPERFRGVGVNSPEATPRFAPVKPPAFRFKGIGIQPPVSDQGKPDGSAPRSAPAEPKKAPKRAPRPWPAPDNVEAPRPRNRIGHPDDISTRTNRQLRADRIQFALEAMVYLRATEFDLRHAPSAKLVQPKVHVDNLLMQHQERDGIHSCVNTSQLNAMLWQGQISPAVGDLVNRSLVDPQGLRQYFTPPDQAQVTRGITYQAGSPSIASHFEDIVPDGDFLHIPVDFARTATGIPGMFDIVVSEINRGSVVVANKNANHTVLVVGYADLHVSSPDTTNLIVIDPLRPGQLERQQYSAFQGISSVLPQLDDPLRAKAAAIS